MERVVTDKQQEQLCQDGFVLLKKALPATWLDEVLDEICVVFNEALCAAGTRGASTRPAPLASEELFELFAKHEASYTGCMRALQNIPSLHRIGVSDHILASLKGLGLRMPAYSTIPLIMLHHPKTARNAGYWRLPAHQDWRSMQGSLNGVVVWTPLVDLTPEMGPLEVIPGSHREGLLPTVEDEWFMHVADEHAPEGDFVPILMDRGDLLVFSAFLVHRSGNNTSNHHRYSMQFRFNDLLEPTLVRRQYPNPYHIRPQKDLITPEFPSAHQVADAFSRSSDKR